MDAAQPQANPTASPTASNFPDPSPKMQTMNMYCTYALPVRAEDLVARLQVHLDNRPALNTLSLCLRFGIQSKLPAELAEQIVGHVVEGLEPVREKASKEWAVASHCSKKHCDLIDHADRADLLAMYRDVLRRYKEMSEEGEEEEVKETWPDDPDDDEMMDTLVAWDIGWRKDFKERHHANRLQWQRKLKQVFSKENRSLFIKQFGLDIWVSTIRLPLDTNGAYRGEDWGTPEMTFAYLMLPRTFKDQPSWQGVLEHETIIYDATSLEPSYVMEGSDRLSDEESHKFRQALTTLGLKIDGSLGGVGFMKPLLGGHDDSGSHDSQGALEKNDTVDVASFPRQMFFIFNDETPETHPKLDEDPSPSESTGFVSDQTSRVKIKD